MASNPIFFDATGKRRKIVNIILPIVVVLSLIVSGFIVYYVIKLEKINGIVKTSETKTVSDNSNTTLLYTENHPKAGPITNDQIEKIDTIIIPKYRVTATSVETPTAYKSFVENINFVSSNKPVHYQRYYLISAKDYNNPPTEREQQSSETTKIDSKLPQLISVDQMLSVREDLLRNKVSGLYIDLDMSVINSQVKSSEFREWLTSFKTILMDKKIKLGVTVQPQSLNEFSIPVLQKSDLLYVSFDSSTRYDTQINKILANQQLFQKNVTYELPTVSRDQNTSEFNNYIKSIDYVTAQNNIIDVPVASRTTEPVTINTKQSNYFINDAITSNNILLRLKSGSVVTKDTQFAIANPGYEEYTLWKLLELPFDTIRNNYLLSENVVASLDIKTEGEGQISSISNSGKYGNRSIELATDSSIIASKIITQNSLPVVVKTGKLPKKIALTFDDGPHPEYTEKVLDILDSYNVKGTFFMVGTNVRINAAIVKEVVNRGHEVENHTFDHPVFSKLTSEAQVNQIMATSALIEELSGQKVQYFRKPYSDNNIITTQADLAYLKELKQLGLQASEYDIDSKDWLLDSSDEVVAKVKKDLEASSGDYSQILFHDAHQGINRTLQALPQVIEYLQDKDIQIVRVDQLDSKPNNPVVASTTSTYRAIDGKNRIFELIVWLNIMLICLALLRYLIILFGAIAYAIRHRLSRSFFKRIDNKQRRTPKLTVIIACYNEELVIGRTIESLLGNTYKNISIIVVNDGSTDATKNIVEAYCRVHKNVKLVNVPNGGKAKALQAGINRARTKWIVFCDADTIFEESALYHFTNTFFANKNLGAVAGRIVVGNDINALTRAQVIEYGISHTFIKASQDAIESITVVPGASGLWSRAALNKIGGFSQDTLAEDADATMELISIGKKVKYNSSVSAKTEAPSTIHMLYKQRTRWQLGNMQAITKHRSGLFNRKYGVLGFFGLPMFYLELLTALLYPVLLTFSAFLICNELYQWDLLVPPRVAFVTSPAFILFSMSLILTELLMGIFVIVIEKKSLRSKMLLLLTLPYYLLYYKTFLSVATIISLLRALRGTFHGWGHLKRTATVK